MIFNKRGVTLKNEHNFLLGGKKLEVTDQYQYLGLKLRPSGSMNLAVEELNTKANRAWFSISKVIFKHKRMEVEKSLQIFDSLVTPVATYGCEFWLPHCLPGKSFKNPENLISSWETFLPEKLNQKCCRMLLSLHKKASRLAVLGELGRYPLFLKSLSHCLNYKLYLNLKTDQLSILGSLMTEMRAMAQADQDCWLSRVEKIETLFNSPKIRLSKSSSKVLNNSLRKKFDLHWLTEVNRVKLGADQINHNKLKTYSTLKSGFTREPYLSLLRNRNQRLHLSRLRTSSHNLGIERGRYNNTPINQRLCVYCTPSTAHRTTPTPPPHSTPDTAPSPTGSGSQHINCIDNEQHFLTQCPAFRTSRSCFYRKMSSLFPDFY